MSDVLVEHDGPIATLTLNRPEQMNAISQSMLQSLSDALSSCDADPHVRAVILTGAGRAFCAGLDLQDAASEEGVAKSGFMLAPTLDLRSFPPVILHDMDTPVICAINGGAAGFGIDLALGCDVRYCAAHAKLSLSFTKRGILPDTGGTWLLPRLIGWSKSAEIVFAGRTLTAHDALERGLVNHVVDDAELLTSARSLAEEIAAGAPLAVQAAKRMMRAGLGESFAEHIQRVYLQVHPLMQSRDFREGVTAFLEKRAPKFEGK